MALRTDKSLADALPGLLRERGSSLRSLAEQTGVSASYMSRVIRRERGDISGRAAEKIAVALDLPGDYFPETRLEMLVRRLEADSTLRDRLFDDLEGP